MPAIKSIGSGLALNSSTGELSATGVEVSIEGNPEGEATAGNLTKLQIGNDIFNVPDTTYSNATTESAGLMSAADKIKLNSLDKDDYTYKNGEPITISGCSMLGCITGSKKILNLAIPLPRNISGTLTFDITSFVVRGDNGYIVPASSNLSSYTIVNSYVTPQGVFISIKNTDDSEFSATVNNSPVYGYIETGTLTPSNIQP